MGKHEKEVVGAELVGLWPLHADRTCRSCCLHEPMDTQPKTQLPTSPAAQFLSHHGAELLKARRMDGLASHSSLLPVSISWKLIFLTAQEASPPPSWVSIGESERKITFYPGMVLLAAVESTWNLLGKVKNGLVTNGSGSSCCWTSG